MFLPCKLSSIQNSKWNRNPVAKFVGPFWMDVPFHLHSCSDIASSALIWNTFHVKYTQYSKKRRNKMRWRWTLNTNMHVEREKEPTASLVKQFSGHAYSASFSKDTHTQWSLEWITRWMVMMLVSVYVLASDFYQKNPMLYYITLDSYNLCEIKSYSCLYFSHL